MFLQVRAINQSWYFGAWLKKQRLSLQLNYPMRLSFLDQQATNEKIHKMDMVNTGELNKLKRLQSVLRDKLRSITRQYTIYLTRVATSSARQFQLEKDLDFSKSSSNDGMKNNISGPLSCSEAEERNRLVALVKIQAKEIDALKMEINLLRRKGGHVYAYSASHNVTGVPWSSVRCQLIVTH